MTQKIYKVFWAWDFEKEEKWLNEMSAKGLHLAGVGFLAYFFEEGAPDEYTIRLQMLRDHPGSAKSKDYIRFVVESGAEYVGSMFRWVYFRKKTNGDEFHLFSDIDSRMRQINALMFMFGTLALAEGMIALSNLLNVQSRTLSLPAALFLGLLACLFGYASLKMHRIRKRLLKERALRE